MERHPDLGRIDSVAKEFPKETTTELLKRMCFSRHFELKVHEVYDRGLIHAPIYLSFGQEAAAAALSLAFSEEKPDIFAQHRAHDLYLSYGGDPVALIDELLGLPTGCARGMGGSASIHCPKIKMHGHDGLMGTQIPIAVGYTLRKTRVRDPAPTLAVMGDASAEEDYVIAALGYASTKRLPILFVCVDNGLSVLTKTELRRNWLVADLAKSLRMPAADIADDPWLIMHQVLRLKRNLPAFLNVQVCRGSSHAGTRKDNWQEPAWNRFELMKSTLQELDLLGAAEAIGAQAEVAVEALWEKRLKEVSR